MGMKCETHINPPVLDLKIKQNEEMYSLATAEDIVLKSGR
jgi:hypothetical protein